ncbi:DNA mismatch repair protein MutT [Pedobacter psychrophilus]|uniref:8-oxo-dGTP diphosphatase n=1 Tax=Pedobacter psychrophilus TaxID=1826909 RepID=A0A179DDT4_9SPHI|nr:(deoxy)nucleoside triphosphate pyrophosphohydrolase [Pedobacter psychrophilus]OAQ38860.1 DNA mismatch repair protein MutT [Pedobacter psychrophilus]
MKNSVIKVTCAIINFKGKILVVQRSEMMSMPLKWEFPGGKVEANESEIDCIKREIKEELDIEISISKRLTPSNYNYPNMSIELIPFLANHKEGEIFLKEHKQYLILAKHELSNLDWADADLPILKEIINL